MTADLPSAVLRAECLLLRNMRLSVVRLSDVSCDDKTKGRWDSHDENYEDDKEDETRGQATLVSRCFSCGVEVGSNDLD